jgi:hypothetical protein
MHQLILEETDGGINAPSIAIIESAYKEFLGREATYNVAFYAVDGEVTDDLWELKKTPAREHDALTCVGNAVIVLNERSMALQQISYMPLNCDH